MSIDAIGSVGGGYSNSSVGSVSKVNKDEFQFEDNIFAADFNFAGGQHRSAFGAYSQHG